MWIPTIIRFVNLFSHSDTTYKFNNGIMTMLLGKNDDDNGSNSNGSGKSTIIEAITLAITGDVYRGVSKEDYIKYGEDFTAVDFELKNDVLNQTLRIKRTIYSSTKPTKLEIYINEQYPEHIPTSTNGGLDIRIGSKYIYDVIGISKEDFLNYYVIGQGNRNSFFTANDIKQKEIISRFSNFTEIDLLIEELSLKDKNYDKELQDKQSNINSCDELIEYFNDEIKEISESFSENKKKEISDKKSEIKNTNDKIIELEKKLSENKEKLTKKQKELSSIILLDTNKIDGKIKLIENKIKDIKKDIRESEKLLSSLNSKTGEIIECPSCQHNFIPNEDLSVEDINESISNIETIISGLDDDKKSQEEQLKIQNNKLLKSNEIKSKRRTLNNEIESFEEIIESQQQNVETYKRKLKRLHKELIEIGKKTLDNETHELKSKLKKQEDVKNEILKTISSIQKYKDDNQFHLFHFGKKGFKTFLANKSIRTIQDICNLYLQKFETNLQVQISGYTVLKSGDVRDKIEISVLKNGLNKGLFNKYSGGEKSRIDVAGIIAINRLINNGCGNRGLDLLILDENVSYLDSTGQEEIIKILSKSKITTILVMHQVDDMPYKYKVFVKKENNNSVII